MELANQTFYIVVFVTLMGLMSSFFWGKDGQKDQYRVIFWPLTLGLFALSSFGFFLIPWLGSFALLLGNIPLVGGAICLTLLFSSWNRLVSRSKKIFGIAIFSGFSVCFLFLLKNGDTTDRIHLVNVVLGGLAIWQISSLFKVSKKDSAYQIRILIAVEIFQLLTRILRSLLLFTNPDLQVASLFQEDVFGFSLRIASVLSHVLVCILITNFYLDKLMAEHQKSAHAIENGMLDSLNALSMVRDNETGNHILRTKSYVELIANRLRDSGIYKSELSVDTICNMTKAAPLHDIGKVGIPDDILKKNGPLSDEEWVVMKTHPFLGEEVLKAAKVEDARHTNVLDVAIAIAGGHHEAWDGTGYPRGLHGHDIPLAARIMSVADMYDALVSERVYKKKWSHEDACEEIARLKGSRFDPAVVDAFLLERENLIRIANLYSD